MAVIVQSQPAIYQPSYNNQWFVATSTQVAQPNFKYRIICTDLISGYTITEDFTPNPSNKLEFDAMEFSKLNMVNYLPVNQFGWKKCTGASRKIRVNIGEVYGAGTPVYYPGSNFDYIVWNASLELFDFANYTLLDYVYDTSAPTSPLLTNTNNSKTFEDRSEYLYWLVKEGNTGDVVSLNVNTYDATGTLIGSYDIIRPDYNTGLYTDQYVCIDVGYKGILNISAFDVSVISGTYPIIDNTVAYYTIDDGFGLFKRIDIECSTYPVYTLHYLNSKGGYDTLNCDLITDLSTNKTSTSFKKSPWSRSGYTKVLDPSGAVEKTLSVTSQGGLRVRSNFITQDEITLHKDLFNSPDVRIDLGIGSAYKSVKITNGTYLEENFDLCRNLEFDLLFNHTNSRQKG